MTAAGLVPDEQLPWRLLDGDSRTLLRELPARSIDAVVTDPPYGIGLRGAAWDRPGLGKGDRVYRPELFERWTTSWAAECLRVLKPGGYLLAFGAPRTAHRLAAGVEDAGLELRDQLVWLYGSGVPKSRSQAGRASTLKPGYEPILLARAPLTGTLATNEARWGTGRLGIDEARIRTSERARGRWPCNVTLTHQEACERGRCRDGCPVALLDQARPSSLPSRFFYCPKPARSERDSGCDTLPARRVRIYGAGSAKPRRNTHPTVKPVELMRWLVRLVCPPGGLVLDPFAGSGSTGVAALGEQRRFLGIERDPGYTQIAHARLSHATTNSRSTNSRPAAAAGRKRRGIDGRPVDGTRTGSVRRTAIHTPERRKEP